MADTLTWIDPKGGEHNLQDPNQFYNTPGVTGELMPPILFQAQGIPLQAGEIPRLWLASARDVLVPVVVKGTSAADFYNNLEIMTQMFYSATSQAPGVLRRVTPNGHTRDLNCFMVDGAKGDRNADSSGLAHMAMVWALHASDPFWYDSEATILTFSPTGVVNFFDNPFFPLKLSVDGQSSAFTIVNSGHDVTYPTWIVSGPATNPSFTNTYLAPNGATLTKTLALTITLADHETLTIITKPGSASIKKQDGSSQFAAMDPLNPFWALQPGNNACSIAITSPGTDTQVVLTYKQAYLNP